jgi:hypothetical protein
MGDSWTEKSLLSNLAAFAVSPTDVAFHDLNEIAWLVEVVKPRESSTIAEAAQPAKR